MVVCSASLRDRVFWLVMSRVIQSSLVLATSFAVAFAVACVAMESATPTVTPTPRPTPTPTISAAGVAAARIAALTAPTLDPAMEERLKIVALTAESEAVLAESILKNAPEDEKAKLESTATVARWLAEWAIATATAEKTRIEMRESLAIEALELGSKYATQEVEDAFWRRRAGNCKRALDIRSDVAKADRWYAERDVSVGELSVFRPDEATARAGALRRASELCP